MKDEKVLCIKPKKGEDSRNCYDNIIISVLEWKKRDFRPMYADQWRFSFEEKESTEGIWKRGIIANYLYFDNQFHTLELLKKYTGTNIVFAHEMSIEQIKVLILNEKPVAPLVDTFYLKWLLHLYQKHHTNHAILLVGFNQNGIYCNDTISINEIVEKEFIEDSLFKKMYMNECSYFEFEKFSFDTGDLVSDIRGYVDKSMFDKIKEFSEYIYLNGFFYEDIEPFENGEGILLRAMRNVIRSRVNYRLALDCVSELLNNRKWDYVSQLIKYSQNNWLLAKSILYKGYLENNINDYRRKIAELILESGKKEYEAYKLLITI